MYEKKRKKKKILIQLKSIDYILVFIGFKYFDGYLNKF